MPFPCAFSRYSTLEELRPVAMRGSKDDGDALRFLALCRVLVGNVRVDDSTAVSYTHLTLPTKA